MNRDTCCKASLWANALLAAIIVVLALRHPEPATPLPTALPGVSRPMTGAAPALDPPIERHELRGAASSTDATAESWIGQLRAAGAPDRVLVRVALADFDERWRLRFDELQERMERGEADEAALAALGRERDQAQEHELRSALGQEAFKRWDQETTLQSLDLRNVSLAAAERDAIYHLQKRLQQQSRELERAKDAGEIDEVETTERQGLAQAQFDQHLKGLLGAGRHAAMQAPENNGSRELRRTLRKVNASEAQFQALAQVESRWMERRDELDRQPHSSPSENFAHEQRIKALDQARDQEFQRVLGASAFETLQKVQDERYTKMKRYAGAWGMDDRSIDYLYQTLKDYERSLQDYPQQARDLEQQGQAVDWDALHKDLEQFSKQTEQTLQTYLGPDRYDRLKQNGVLPFQTEQ